MRNIENVSVLMTVYNDAEYIKAAIRSILSQTFRDFELIIIDDGSTDLTQNTIMTFHDPRIRYFYVNHIGREKALNMGLKMANYDWISIMDSDDIAHPKRLAIQVSKLNSGEMNVIGCNSAIFNNNNIHYLLLNQGDHRKVLPRLALHCILTHSGIMYQRDLVVQAGGYNECLVEDYDLFLRLKGVAKFYILPDILSFIRLRNDSRHNRDVLSSANTVHALLQKYYIRGISEEFEIEKNQINNFWGWREYFYGNKSEARKYWRISLKTELNGRVLIAFIISYIPEFFFTEFRKSRITLRIRYLIFYFSKANRDLRRLFSDIDS